MTASFQTRTISTILLGEPGLMRDSICTLLNAIPNVHINLVVDLSKENQDLANNLTINCVIFDCSGNIPDFNTLVMIKKFKKDYPQIHCLVITASLKHNAIYLSAGADMALVRGFSLNDLRQALEYLFVVP
jgi:DNA-binding NarL/FixJ family response regulator